MPEKLEVEEIIDRNGDAIHFYAKGHWPKTEFLKAARAYAQYCGAEPDEVDEATVAHEYARWLPCRTEYFDFIIRFADQPSRGAFPLTICDIG